nr:exodeoxyribonuclease V subunit gamma [Rhodococcus sp. HNM0569]
MRLHRAERTDTLADELAHLLRTPLDDPFAPEVVSVPAKGVERWLTQRLSSSLGTSGGVHADGVAANIEFPSPTRLVDDVSSAAAGIDPDGDPWVPSRLVWTVLSVVDASLSEPWCAPLARHLGGGTDEYRTRRRFATALHIAQLFRSYGAQRPHMLTDWAAGRATDGAGSAVPDDSAWQVHVWQRVRAELGVPSGAERLADTCAALRADPSLTDLPPRVSLFGPTRLTTEQLAVVAALSAHRDVHVWLPHPSPTMWDVLRDRAAPPTRGTDTSALDVRHPLLSSLSRDVRELQFRAAGLDELDLDDRYHAGPPPAASLLGTLQDDIAHDRAPSRAGADDSVQVHACHGPARQVEVLRDALLHAFADDPTLEPRDVVVMCPDVETFAPLVRAVFGQPGDGAHEHPAHRLRVRLADRGLRRTNPVLDVLATLLGLAEGRVTASEVLDVAAAGPVRCRFGFADDDLERIRQWTAESGARWGISGRQRAEYGLDGFPQNTFGTALDRILLGACADESDGGWLGLALPLDDVDSSDIDLAGRFAEFVDRLDVVLRRLAGPHAGREWGDILAGALDLLTDTPLRERWQGVQARSELAEGTEFGGDAPLALADVRAMLSARLAGRPTRANFRTGELTVCTMVPMRSVPHRVVALLGLDDDVFPRSAGVDGDDLTARDPLLGERDPRSEDRQLMLDAIMSASDRLLVFYTGCDPVNGTDRPPAIPLGGLMDVLDAMTGGPAAGVVRRHPLQPFDPRNFAAPRPFGFDPAALAGARASAAPPRPVPSLGDVVLGAPPRSDVDLTELVAFLVDPAQGFLRQRLGFRVPERDETPADSLSVQLDALERWDVGDRMLQSRLDGEPADRFRAAEWRRGTLPPFGLGNAALAEVEFAVDALAAACAPLYRPDAHTAYVAVDLGDGRRITGTVPGIRDGVLVRSSFSRLGPKHRMTAWVQLLAVAADGRYGPVSAATTGRGSGHRPAWRSTLTAPGDALAVLRRLVDLRDRGLRQPLPIAPTASGVYAERRVRGDGPDEAYAAADNSWSSRFGDHTNRVATYLYGPKAPFTAVSGGAGEVEPTRFGDLAVELWSPLLGAETVGQP